MNDLDEFMETVGTDLPELVRFKTRYGVIDVDYMKTLALLPPSLLSTRERELLDKQRGFHAPWIPLRMYL